MPSTKQHSRLWLCVLVCPLVCLSGFGRNERIIAADVRPHRLGPGDVLAIVVHGVIGKFGDAPVVFPGERQDLQPAIGYPIQVQRDGCLHLPSLEPLNVTGLTVVEAKQAVDRAYTNAEILRRPNQVMLTLMQRRRVQVHVLHDQLGGASRAETVQLSADQATLLGAVAAAESFDRDASVRALKPRTGESGRLPDSSVVQLQAPRPAYFTTGGRLAGGRHLLPRHQPLDALQAIAAAGGIQPGGVLPALHLTIVRRNAPTSRVPLRHVLNRPSQYLIRPGDHLIVH